MQGGQELTNTRRLIDWIAQATRGQRGAPLRPPPATASPSFTRTTQAALLALPPLLLASTTLAYRSGATRLGAKRGYGAGFLFYWSVWGLLVPLSVLGPQGLRAVFREARPPLGRRPWLGAACLVLPPLLGFSYAFPRQLPRATARSVALSAGLALVNATTEELLWRGLYTTAFPNDVALGYVYPAIGFALWHLAPQTVVPSDYPGGALAFVGSAGLWGLLYGWVAWQTRSIRWTTFSHVLLDFSGLGGAYYLGR